MNADELRNLLTERGITHTEKNVQDGTQFRCNSGEIFNVFETGNASFQGKKTALSAEVKAWHESGVRPGQVSERVGEGASIPAPPARPVFIVYGHDTAARDALELLLRRMGLAPIIIGHLPAAGDTVIEKLERYLGEHGNVGFACVLLTPDDEGHKAGRAEEKKYRARQNVVLELGMVLARLGRRRVAILHKESVELPSDIAGLIYIPFQERLEDAKTRLFNELHEAGFDPNPVALH